MATRGPDHFQKKLARGLKECGYTHTAEDIKQAVDEGRMQSWVNNDSLVITEVLGYPQGRELNVVLVVGDIHDIMEMQPRIDAFAREHGCHQMRTTGRPGLINVLPHYGWKPSKKIIFERSL
jgi:hypothetical protein